MLATIAAPISASFGSLTQLSWLTTTLTIGSSITQPISGQISDIFGRRAGLIVALSLLAIGTLLCGLAPHLWVFLMGRVIQGLGAGAVTTITAFVETDLVPLRKRALIEGLGNIVYGTVLALGGVYGGSVESSIGWKWAFLVQVPLIAIDIMVVSFVLKIPRSKTPRKASALSDIDYAGIACLLSFVVLFQFAINSGGTMFQWNSAPVVATLVVSIASFILFIFWELKKARKPLLPLRSIMQRSVASAQLSAFMAFFGNIIIMYYTPIYLQVLGLTTTQSGLRFISLAICFAVASFVTGILITATARYFLVNVPVQMLSILGSVLLCTMSTSTPLFAPFIYLGIYGAGSGGAFVTRLMGILSSVERGNQATIQAASWVICNMGTTLGLAVSGSVFSHLSRGELVSLLKDHPDVLDEVTSNLQALETLAGPVRQSAVSIYVRATRGNFILASSALLLAAVASFCMENRKLKG